LLLFAATVDQYYESRVDASQASKATYIRRRSHGDILREVHIFVVS
jgi:hypothetical protein